MMVNTKRRLEWIEAQVASTLGQAPRIFSIVWVDRDGKQEDGLRIVLYPDGTSKTYYPPYGPDVPRDEDDPPAQASEAPEETATYSTLSSEQGGVE